MCTIIWRNIHTPKKKLKHLTTIEQQQFSTKYSYTLRVFIFTQITQATRKYVKNIGDEKMKKKKHH